MVIDRKQDMFFVLLEQAPQNASVSSGPSSGSSINRWRTDVLAGRRLVAAALAIFFIGGWPHEVRAIPGAAVPSAARADFSRAALDHIGDYIRNEVATGKIPGAILLIQQHGKPVYFECFGVRTPRPGSR